MFQELGKEEQQRLPKIGFEQALASRAWPRLREYFAESIKEGSFQVDRLKKALAQGADLQGLDLGAVPAGSLDGLVFEGGSLQGARLPSCKNTTFTKVHLQDASVVEGSLQGVTFKDCPMSKCYFRDVELSKVTFSGKTVLNQTRIFSSKLQQVRFEGSSAIALQLFELECKDCNFSSQNLLGSSFISVVHSNSDFRKADLRASDWVLGGIDQQTRWQGAIFAGGERMPEEWQLREKGSTLGNLEGVREQLPKEAWRNYSARAGNPIPLLRKELAALAAQWSKTDSKIIQLNGSGRRIIHIEQVKDPLYEGAKPRHNRHSSAVASRMRSSGSSGGLATAADYELIDIGPDVSRASFDYDRLGLLRIREDSPKVLDEILERQASELMRHLSERLKEIADAQANIPAGRTDAINVSMGISRAKLYSDLALVLDSRVYPRLCDAVYGEDSDLLPAELRLQRLMDYVDARTLPEQSEHIRGACTAYDKEVERLWQQGTIVVVSAGNDRPAWQMVLGEVDPKKLIKRGAPEMSLLARGKVLSVAASESAGTPATVSDDLIAPFSSRGEGRSHPALAAHGESVLINFDISDGTSFASPHVVAVLALMREVHPSLSAERAVAILKETSLDNPAIPAEEEGAGQLRLLDALKKARQERIRLQH